MDARQRFYDHNRLLQRFLIGATVVFVGVVTLLWWQEQSHPRHVGVPTTALRHFSAEASMADVTRAYAYGARIIHDIEAYPEVRELFFSESLRRELGESTLEDRLSEVAAAEAAAVPYGREHVYHTSYYTGNLMVLPGLSLHELLIKEPAPETALLLETALADIRAGAVKIAHYYDVAPPSWYHATSSARLYYPAPSFPSLTVSETMMALYLLATVDPDRARRYEQAAESFASQVFSTGAHFRLDVEYAIKLAAAYHDLILRTPEYAGLLTAAKAEWAESPFTEIDGAFLPPELYFALPDFPIPSAFAVSSKNYATSTVGEELRGSLRLSLVDTRLPKPALRLYEYDLIGSGTILPTALDLTPKQFPGLLGSVGYARYLADGSYLFLSGEVEDDTRGGYDLASTSVHWRNSNVTPVTLDPVPPESAGVQNVVLRNTGDEFLFVPIRYASNESRIMRAQLDLAYHAKVTEIARGQVADYIGDNAVVYIRDGSVYYVDLETGTETALRGVSVGTGLVGEFTDLTYFPEQRTLALVAPGYATGGEIRKDTVYLYSITETAGAITARERAEITLTDVRISSLMLSPGGQYLALTKTRGETGQTPALLLFDINNGIIKKEIDLSSFAVDPLEIDGWTLF